jgi:hypothetical protein
MQRLEFCFDFRNFSNDRLVRLREALARLR